MRHLKRFNESINNSLEEVKKFCNSNLAFLIDAGFKVEVFDYTNSPITIVLSKATDPREKNKLYKWNDVKYDFIPFIELLSTKSTFCDVTFVTRTDKYEMPIEDIIEDNFGNLTHIKYISIDL